MCGQEESFDLQGGYINRLLANGTCETQIAGQRRSSEQQGRHYKLSRHKAQDAGETEKTDHYVFV